MNKIQISIETYIFSKENGSYDVRLAAVVWEGERALQGKKLQFYVDGRPVDSIVETDVNGRATYDVKDLKSGQLHVAEVSIQGTAISASKDIYLSASEEEASSSYSSASTQTQSFSDDYYLNHPAQMAKMIIPAKIGAKVIVKLVKNLLKK